MLHLFLVELYCSGCPGDGSLCGDRPHRLHHKGKERRSSLKKLNHPEYLSSFIVA